MSRNSVKGKSLVHIFIDNKIELARDKYCCDTFAGKSNTKAAVYQQAMAEFLKSRGYLPSNNGDRS